MKPAIFTDGSDYYQELSKTYETHETGFFILAPSGVGKTHFCKKQKELHWIDGDHLWETSGAHPAYAWWLEPIEIMNHVDIRSDMITYEAKKSGFWIMGASNSWLKPDAIVIPNWDQHVSYIKHREENNYDGGAKSDRLDQVKEHIAIIEKWHTDHDVPKFSSVQEATNCLANRLK